MATVACAAFLGWWKTAIDLRHNRVRLDAMLHSQRLPPKAASFVSGSYNQPDYRYKTPQEFITELRSATASDWHESEEMAASFASTMADETIPQLLELLDDQDVEIRARALSALSRIERRADVIVPAIIPHLNSENPGIRWYAASALGNLKHLATTAVPALVEQMNDDQSPIAVFSAITLREIDPTIPTEATLIELLPKQAGINRSRAIDALADLGTPTARDALVRTFQVETNQDVSNQLAHAIKRIDNVMAKASAEPRDEPTSREPSDFGIDSLLPL